MNIAVIPARGGSKRIPRKNVRPFLGKPMLAWPIGVLQASGLFERIIVSTDDAEIAQTARDYGAETPFVRPAELADDHTGTSPVVVHAIRWLEEHQGIRPDLVCCVYATTPLLSLDFLRQGHEALMAHPKRDFAFSVTSFPFPVQRGIRITPEGGTEPLYPEFIPYRSQDLEPAYHDAGQFYWGRRQAWLDRKPIFRHYSLPIILPRHLVQDIDDAEDWRRAELLAQVLQAELHSTAATDATTCNAIAACYTKP